MRDEEGAILEGRGKEGEAKRLIALMRAGTLTEERVRLAAGLGSEGALLLFPGEEENWKAAREVLNERERRALGARMARQALSCMRGFAFPDGRRIDGALEAAERCISLAEEWSRKGGKPEGVREALERTGRPDLTSPSPMGFHQGGRSLRWAVARGAYAARILVDEDSFSPEHLRVASLAAGDCITAFRGTPPTALFSRLAREALLSQNF